MFAEAGTTPDKNFSKSDACHGNGGAPVSDAKTLGKSAGEIIERFRRGRGDKPLGVGSP
jgi:hypothetical protein